MIRLTERQKIAVKYHAQGLNGNETAREMGVSNQVVYMLRRHVIDNYGSLDAAVEHVDMDDDVYDDDEQYGPFRRCQFCDLILPCHHEPMALIKANWQENHAVDHGITSESPMLHGSQGGNYNEQLKKARERRARAKYNAKLKAAKEQAA